MKKVVLLIFSILLFFSCKKAENRACIKSIGDESVQERVLEDFSLLDLGPHLKYTLVQDTVNKVIINGGKNLLNFISTDVSDGLLSIQNKNKCNFLRNLNEVVNVEVHFKEVINIYSESTEEVYCSSLNTDYLTLALRDGIGQLNVNVNVINLNVVVAHGWGNFKLSGSANYAKFDVRSNGFGDAYGLNVQDSIHAISNSSEVFRINSANCLLKSQTKNFGDIWYKGVPTEIEHLSTGVGELVNKN